MTILFDHYATGNTGEKKKKELEMPALSVWYFVTNFVVLFTKYKQNGSLF